MLFANSMLTEATVIEATYMEAITEANYLTVRSEGDKLVSCISVWLQKSISNVLEISNTLRKYLVSESSNTSSNI